MRLFLLIVSILSVLALYMLVVATGYAAKLSEYFWWVAAFSGLLMLILLFVLLRQLWRLWRQERKNIFGAKLSRRLVMMFTWVTILPGLFLFAVSTQFIVYSINSWFGDETEEALSRSLSLSKLTLKAATDQTFRQAEAVREQLNSTSGEQTDLTSFVQVMIVDKRTGQWQTIYRAEGQALPSPRWDEAKGIDQAKSGNISIQNRLYTDIWLPMDTQGERIIFFRQPVVAKVANDVTLIENARAKYAELTFAKQGLQTFFLLTLVMATLLAMMLAVLLAIFFARRFVAPLQSLAEATQAVAQGNFHSRAPVYRNDEMGMLSARFNRMTEQLETARMATNRLHKEQEEAKQYLELVLSSLTTGVMTFDAQGCLKTFNDSAIHILTFPLHQLVGKCPQSWHKEGTAAGLIARFVDVVREDDSQSPIESEYGGCDKIKILLGKMVALPDDAGQVLVFDDVTNLVRAQKEAAWGEVARRLAHEIRNPLTPIQLSAERLAWKLADRLPENEQGILQRSTNTIIKQVAALQEMVEGFRNYARSASLKLTRNNLNDLVAEVLVLYEGSECVFEPHLSENILKVDVDVTAIRQVLHNIFKNAAEAALADTSPHVKVCTLREENNAVLTVVNNGLSFDSVILSNVFEPYVTNKANGTGLGLAVVKKIVDEHKGQIELGNNDQQNGAWLKIKLPIVE